MKMVMTIFTILLVTSCNTSNKSGGKKSVVPAPTCGLSCDETPQQEEQAPSQNMKTVAKVNTAININSQNDRRGRKFIDILETVSDDPGVDRSGDCSIFLQNGMTIKAIRLGNSLRLVDESGLKIYDSIDTIPNRGIQGKWRFVEELEAKTVRTIINIMRDRMSIRKTCIYR